MTETSTTTNTRPTVVDDLSDYERRPHSFATVADPSHLLAYPTVGQHLLAAITEAQRLGLSVEAGEITVPLTEHEETNRLVSAQRQWDYRQQSYLEAVADPTSIPEGYRRSSIDAFASAEKLPAIEWPAAAVTR